jgi:hypothetical protein
MMGQRTERKPPQETEIRRIMVHSQFQATVHETLS